ARLRWEGPRPTRDRGAWKGREPDSFQKNSTGKGQTYEVPLIKSRHLSSYIFFRHSPCYCISHRDMLNADLVLPGLIPAKEFSISIIKCHVTETEHHNGPHRLIVRNILAPGFPGERRRRACTFDTCLLQAPIFKGRAVRGFAIRIGIICRREIFQVIWLLDPDFLFRNFHPGQFHFLISCNRSTSYSQTSLSRKGHSERSENPGYFKDLYRSGRSAPPKKTVWQ